MEQARHRMTSRARHTCIVRLAEPEDCVSVLKTLRKALLEGYYDMPLPEPDLPYCIQAFLDQVAQGLVHVVVASNGEIVGLLALYVARWPWTVPSNPKGRYLTNEHFWVERAYRSGGTARTLLRAAKDTADKLQLPLMIEIASGGADAPLKDRFVKACGFSYVGGKMFREPKPLKA